MGATLALSSELLRLPLPMATGFERLLKAAKRFFAIDALMLARVL